MSTDLINKIECYVEKFGETAVIEKLAELEVSPDKDTLTIISNKGAHPIPQSDLRGEVFVASEGQLDFSSIERVKAEYEEILKKVAIKLKERQWCFVYILPFGHITLSMQIKLLVQKVLSIESIELFHMGNGKYENLSISQRPLIVSVGK